MQKRKGVSAWGVSGRHACACIERISNKGDNRCSPMRYHNKQEGKFHGCIHAASVLCTPGGGAHVLKGKSLLPCGITRLMLCVLVQVLLGRLACDGELDWLDVGLKELMQGGEYTHSYYYISWFSLASRLYSVNSCSFFPPS